MKKLLISLAAAVMAVGCTMVDEGGITVEKNALLASSKDNTRTEMVQDGETFYHNWVKGDAFALMDGARFIKYELQGEGGSTDEVFTGEAPVGPGPYYVYYPYKETFMDIYTDATVKSTFEWVFPSEVEYTGGNIAGEDAMIGLSIDGKKVSMKNMCGYIRLSLYSPVISFLKTLEITAPGGEAIAGPYHVDLTPEGIPELTLLDSYDNIVPSNKVTINFPDKILSAIGTDLYIPLPAIELSQGLKFVLNGDFAGEPEIVLSSSTATLERNIVVVMPEYFIPSEEAQIDDTIYETVGEAFDVANASNEEVTVKLLRSCMAAKQLLLDGTGTGAVILDLNGKNLTLCSNNVNTQGLKIEGRKLTITDINGEGKGMITASNQYGIYLSGENSSLDFVAGKMEHNYTGSNNSSAMHLLAPGACKISGVELHSSDRTIYAGSNTRLEVTDAKVTSDLNAFYLAGSAVVNVGEGTETYATGGATFYCVGSSEVNVTDGTHARGGSGNGYVFYTASENAVVNISGGWYDNFDAANANPIATATSSGGKVNVSGGYFMSYGVNPVGCSSPGVSRVTGGYFNKQIQPLYLDGMVNVLNSDPATCEKYPFTVDAVPVVAVVTQGSYTYEHAQFESAIMGANQRALANGVATVTMQDNAEFNTVKINGDNAYAVNIDLNGKTVSSTSSPAITVENGAALNISDGSAAASGELDAGTGTAVSVAGTLNVNNGSVVGTINVAGGTLKVADGHFYGANADITKTGGSVELGGGFYKNVPDRSMLKAKCTVVNAQETFNGRSYAYKVEGEPVAYVNDKGYSSFAAAAAAVKTYNDPQQKVVTLRLNDNVEYNEPLDLVNDAEMPVVLDLHGFVLSTNVSSFIYPSSGFITITDRGEKKGKLTSSSYQVIYAAGTAEIEILNCHIEGTQAEASAWNAQTLILHGGSSKVTYINAKIEATGFQTAIRINNTKCAVTINDNTEISSGTKSAKGFYGIINNNGTLTINSVSIYTKSAPTTQEPSFNAPSAIHHSSAGATTVINDGYFYGAEDRTISGNYGTITINGGYFDKAPVSNKVKYGKDIELISLKVPVTHTHNTTGQSLSYAWQAVNTGR